MTANHQQQPRSVAELPMRSFHFPGTTVNFSHAVVLPGHLEPPESGSNFTADGPPFLWTNPDYLGLIMRQDEPRLGTSCGRQPVEGLGNAFVGADSGRGIAGSEASLPSAPSRVVAQPSSIMTQHSSHPLNLPFTTTSGPSFPAHSTQWSTISTNIPPIPSNADIQHLGVAPPLTATRAGVGSTQCLWKDGTSALSKWYDENLDVRVKQQRASRQPRREGTKASKPAPSTNVQRGRNATLEQEWLAGANGTSSLPIVRDEGFHDNMTGKQQAIPQAPNASDGVDCGEPQRRDVTTMPEAYSATAPQILEPRPVHRRNAPANLLLSHQPYQPLAFHTAEMPPLTAPATSFGENQRLPPDFRQPVQQYLHLRSYDMPSQAAYQAPDISYGVDDGGRNGGDVASGNDGITDETLNDTKPQHVYRWNAPADLNLVPDVYHPSSFDAAEMPPPTAPATSYGPHAYFPSNSRQPWQQDSGSRFDAAPRQSAHFQPFAFTLDESTERDFRHLVRRDTCSLTQLTYT